MNIMERKNTDLIKEFNRYIREHPEFADSIPDNAIVIMQLEDDEEFNKWALDLAKSHAEKGKDLIYVRIKRIKPIRSRIEELELQQLTLPLIPSHQGRGRKRGSPVKEGEITHLK